MHLIHIDKDENFVKIFKKKSPLKRDPTRKKKRIEKFLMEYVLHGKLFVKHIIVF
jgi:hypothetical protein